MRILGNFYEKVSSIIANGGVLMKKYIIFSLLLLGLYTFSACYPIAPLSETDENQNTPKFNIENTDTDGESNSEQNEKSENEGGTH